jgi:hypothetical protein
MPGRGLTRRATTVGSRPIMSVPPIHKAWCSGYAVCSGSLSPYPDDKPVPWELVGERDRFV